MACIEKFAKNLYVSLALPFMFIKLLTSKEISLTLMSHAASLLVISATAVSSTTLFLFPGECTK